MVGWEDVEVGDRVLLEIFGMVFEATVVEVSPSGRYVKIKCPYGRERWIETRYYDVIEVLER